MESSHFCYDEIWQTQIMAEKSKMGNFFKFWIQTIRY